MVTIDSRRVKLLISRGYYYFPEEENYLDFFPFSDTKPPDFKDDPTGAYEFLQKAYEELIGSRDKVKEQNRALRSMVTGHTGCAETF